MMFRGILRVKYRIPILLVLASTFAFGVWLFKGPAADRSAEQDTVHKIVMAGGSVDETEFSKAFNAEGIDILCGSLITLGSFLAAVVIIVGLPDLERDFLRDQKRAEDEIREAPARAARQAEYERKQAEERAARQLRSAAERKEEEERAENEKAHLERVKALEEKGEYAEIEKVHSERVKALEKEIQHKREAAHRKLQLEALERKAQADENDVRADIARKSAKAEIERKRAAILAAQQQPPQTSKEASASQYLSDREIEQIVLRAFRRIGSLPLNEQADAWDEWEADITAEYDDYVTGEILTHAQELRGM